MQAFVEIDGVSKAFRGQPALVDVSFAARPASVHALVGENGAGKSTLMKILAGVHRPDHGTVRLGGVAVAWRSPSEARRGGVSTVFQEFILVPTLSVAENLFLGRERSGRFGRIDARGRRAGTAAVLGRVGLDVGPDQPVASLSIAEQQLLEIARGLVDDAALVILDEPPAALAPAEAERLFALVHGLRAEGKTIFYISHRMPEIFALADDVTVLKDGRHVMTVPAAETTPAGLVGAMVGRDVGDLFPPRGAGGGAAVLEIEGLAAQGLAGPVDLTVAAGEIVALVGLEGQGQRPLVSALLGLEPPHAGRIRLAGRDVAGAAGPSRAIAVGLGFLPEDRKGEGLCLDLSIGDNIRLGVISGRPLAGLRPRLAERLPRLFQDLDVRARSPSQRVGDLSGGNQQKVMLARWLARGVTCLICEEPTRGVDVGAKAEIYRLLRRLADDGVAILAVSRDLPEAIGLADRLAVMRGGRIAAVLPGAGASEESVMRAAFGAAA